MSIVINSLNNSIIKLPCIKFYANTPFRLVISAYGGGTAQWDGIMFIKYAESDTWKEWDGNVSLPSTNIYLFGHSWWLIYATTGSYFKRSKDGNSIGGYWWNPRALDLFKSK